MPKDQFENSYQYPRALINDKAIEKPQKTLVEIFANPNESVAEYELSYSKKDNINLESELNKINSELSRTATSQGSALRRMLVSSYLQTICYISGTLFSFVGVGISEYWQLQNIVYHFNVGPIFSDTPTVKFAKYIGRFAGWFTILYIFMLPYRFLRIGKPPITSPIV